MQNLDKDPEFPWPFTKGRFGTFVFCQSPSTSQNWGTSVFVFSCQSSVLLQQLRRKIWNCKCNLLSVSREFYLLSPINQFIVTCLADGLSATKHLVQLSIEQTFRFQDIMSRFFARHSNNGTTTLMYGCIILWKERDQCHCTHQKQLCHSSFRAVARYTVVFHFPGFQGLALCIYLLK